MSAHQCRIYLHPAVASNPDTIRAVTARTGLAVIIGGNSKAATLQQSNHASAPSDQADYGPYGGGAA